MNKVIMREARKKGFTIEGNDIVYESIKVELNSFLVEVNKKQFTHSIRDAIEDCKTELFLNGKKENTIEKS